MYPKKWKYFLNFLILLIVALSGVRLSTLHSEKHTLLPYIKEYPQLNKEYFVITDSDIAPKILPENTVSVIEFFSYHCHTCYEIEPVVRAWLELQPDFVRFEQIPIGEGNNYSDAVIRLHYFLHQLKKSMTSTLFQWLYEEKEVQNPAVIKDSLLKIGVSNQDYERAMHWQSGLDAQVTRGKNLEKFYNVEEIPVFIIGGRYKTSPIMTNGDLLRFFEVMDALIEKVKQGQE